MTEAWTDKSTRILWLRDLLPKSLDIARVLTFGYDASTVSFYGARSADRIQHFATTLVADLVANRSLEGCSRRPILFICHGLGGILVKKALTYSSTRTSEHVAHLYSIFVSTYGILFFGTPHNGTDTGLWKPSVEQTCPSGFVPSQSDSQLLSSMHKDSEILQIITEQFSSLTKQFHIFFFWEEIETFGKNGKGYIVEEASAAPIIDNTERAGIAADHMQMIRFSDTKTSSYRTVVEALIRYCRCAPSLISRRWEQAVESLTRTWSNEVTGNSGIAFDVHHNNRPFQYERKLSERPQNKHFYIPQVVSSIFTGREDISETVRKCLLSPGDCSPARQQRRYVIHGIGGSGKTQFCSKFAQDHRERFWGVFWIDATSIETAKQSFAKIGTLGGLEATQSAGKHWLSNSEETWLLILNNADNPLLDLADLFPEGQRGCILVTTRNPNFRIHATVGSTEFKGLTKADALILFLRAADIQKPWTSAVESTAHKITDTLGRLALAVIQAGALIMQKICEVQDYLEYYETFRSNIKLKGSSENSNNNDQLTIYATWEHSLESLKFRQTEPCLDALELLSTVAFFHFDHIRIDIFTRALDNKFPTSSFQKKSITQRLSNAIIARLQPPPILPRFFKQGSAKRIQLRVRRALNELRSFSLISYNGTDDSFSLHPVVHSWARDRLSIGDQAVWAQVASNVLAESIQLPPNDVGEKHEEYRRDILVHIDFCLKAKSLDILDYGSIFGGLKLPFALLFQNMWLFTFREQLTNGAKYGYVYLERGRFHEAAGIFSRVKDALVQSRGCKNEKTMAVMLALAATLWGLGRLEEAIALQKVVLDARTYVNGSNHADTLSAMDKLGKSFWLNGQYKEALELQSLAVERMRASLGSDNVITNDAMDNLGVTYGSWRRYNESRELHQEVLSFRKKTQGPTHADTLTTMNNLAMAYMDLGSLGKARELMYRVYDHRKTKIGKEHPWTLWALCNLAKVVSELRMLNEAEEMLVMGIAAAKRSLGDDHLGVLMGVGELARVYARQGRLEESERLTTDTIKRMEKSRGLGHPDTVYALHKLAQLHEMQGKMKKAIEVCELAGERAGLKLTSAHPMTQDIAAQLQKLKTLFKDRPEANAEDGSSSDKHHTSVDGSAQDPSQPAKTLRSYKTF
ncbi:hypothetical protein ACLMJK_005565 [Lecanora helva]